MAVDFIMLIGDPDDRTPNDKIELTSGASKYLLDVMLQDRGSRIRTQLSIEEAGALIEQLTKFIVEAAS